VKGFDLNDFVSELSNLMKEFLCLKGGWCYKSSSGGSSILYGVLSLVYLRLDKLPVSG
jgi:hypothetical protein